MYALESGKVKLHVCKKMMIRKLDFDLDLTDQTREPLM